MSSSGFFMRSSMAQFDPVDFNRTTAQAALLPITVDLAGHRQAQPFAAPLFWGTSLSGCSHFLCGRRFSSSAIHSNNCFPTGPSCNSFATGTALACSGVKWAKPRRGISLLLARFFLRPVIPSHLSCGQTSQPARHDSVFHLCRIEESHFCSVFRKGKSHSF